MPLTCRVLDAAAAPAWDAFVLAHPEGSFFHRAAWAGVIAQGFGHTPHYLYAISDGCITGVLPLVQVRTRLFGHSLISVPFCVYGGPIGDADSVQRLTEQAEALMARLGAPVMEFRSMQPDTETPPGWVARSDLYVTFRKAIVADDAANMKAIPRKQRAMVRKGIEAGLVSVLDRTPDRLHRVYAESVRNLGTPVFARRYFRLLAETFGPDCDVLTVLDAGVPIASVMNFYFRDEVLPYYGGGTAAARGRYGNDFMYWEVMRRAAARGCRLFDYGRSKQGTGAFAFKKNWGFEPAPLQYRFRLSPGARLPDLNPLNPKYRLFIAAWKRLPLPVANLIGPHIVRGIG